MSIAERIKQIRKEKKLSQLEFAEIINVDNSTISKFENGKATPTIEQLLEISSNFGVTTDFILKGDIERELIIKEVNEDKSLYDLISSESSFPAKLKKFIKNKNLTIEQFAGEVDYSRGSINNYLTGAVNPTFGFLMAMVKRFPETDLDLLLRDIKEKPQKIFLLKIISEQQQYVNLVKKYILSVEETTEEIKNTLNL